ncbi:MAG: TerC family protein [Gammaproteobacteria bacterium]|nr:TerC family protein [Gammaproteobacteria bacterium]
MELLTNPEIWAAFATLTILEIVLGIDNIIFISILTGRLPPEQQARGRYIGLGLAMVMRILLLLSLTWIMQLTAELFVVMERSISGRDLILLVGGAFLMAKATREVHNALEGESDPGGGGAKVSFVGVMVQIAIIDMVFSLDSVITAVGLVQEVRVMIAAVVTSVFVMMIAAGPISRFVTDHPTIKMLALSFLLLIGLTLVGEGLDIHTPKGYIYFAMAFSFGVEILNIRAKRKRQDHVHLRKTQLADLVNRNLPEESDRPD